MYLLLGSFFEVMKALDPVVFTSDTYSECIQVDVSLNTPMIEVLEQIQSQLRAPGCNPPRNHSCQEILYCFPSASSGVYELLLPNGSLVQAYCDMEGTNCGNTTGWTRVAYVNMTQPGAVCPTGLTQRLFSGKSFCGRSIVGCQSAFFSAFGISYSRVCGQLRGYHYGGPDAFSSYLHNNLTTVDDNYVDGASITYGKGPRKHIWTYALGSQTNRLAVPDCPCNTGSTYHSPPYIGNDYYCESATKVFNSMKFYANDPLWDGEECTNLETPCCTYSNMPWFVKTLGETTTDDIELRVCGSDVASNEDSPLDVIELFVR